LVFEHAIGQHAHQSDSAPTIDKAYVTVGQQAPQRLSRMRVDRARADLGPAKNTEPIHDQLSPRLDNIN
jgi:hypothetical protein